MFGILPSLVLSLSFLLPGASYSQTPGAAVPASPAVSRTLEDPAVTALALKLYAQARAGKVDATLLSPEMQQALGPATIAQAKPLFDQLGDPTRVLFLAAEKHTKGVLYTYLVTFPTAQFHVRIFIHPDGKFAGYGLDP